MLNGAVWENVGPNVSPTRTSLTLYLLLALASVPSGTTGQATTIPASNDPKLTEPPPRPPLGDLETRAAQLLDAIVHDDPARAMGLFLPREAFAVIKAVRQPDPLYDRLVRAYERDIHALHKRLPDITQARFVRVSLSHRRSFVRVREEANLLPYWAQRHNTLVYKAGSKTHTIELRVLIAWNNTWYLTHLSEFR